MSEDQFTKLFKYMEKRFADVDDKFEEARKDRQDIRGAILQIAKETGVKLQVEL